MDMWGHLTAAEVLPAFTPPTFTETVSDTLGNLGDPTDGFDDELAQANADLDSFGNLIDLLDNTVDGILGFIDGVDDNPLAQSTDGLAQSIADGTSDRDAFAQLVAPGDAPPANQGGTQPLPSTALATSPTPAGDQACQNAYNVTDYTVKAGLGQQQLALNYASGFVGVTVTIEDVALVPTSDPAWIAVDALTPVQVGQGGTVQAAWVYVDVSAPGVYTAQVQWTIVAPGDQQPEVYNTCIQVTAN